MLSTSDANTPEQDTATTSSEQSGSSMRREASKTAETQKHTKKLKSDEITENPAKQGNIREDIAKSTKNIDNSINRIQSSFEIISDNIDKTSQFMNSERERQGIQSTPSTQENSSKKDKQPSKTSQVRETWEHSEGGNLATYEFWEKPS